MTVYIIIFIFIAIFIIALRRDKKRTIILNGIPYELNKSTLANDMEKAILLHIMREKLKTVVEHLYTTQKPTAAYANSLKTRFYKLKVMEIEPENNSSLAYVLNKDEEMRICLRKNTDGTYDEESILFILLHELAHVMSTEFGHASEFQTNMDFIIREAVKIGVYTPRDFSKNPASYCGGDITSSPCDNNGCPSV